MSEMTESHTTTELEEWDWSAREFHTAQSVLSDAQTDPEGCRGYKPTTWVSTDCKGEKSTVIGLGVMWRCSETFGKDKGVCSDDFRLQPGTDLDGHRHWSAGDNMRYSL